MAVFLLVEPKIHYFEKCLKCLFFTSNRSQ